MVVQDRVESLLALILLHHMKGSPQRDKAVQLSLAGFSNTEIADLLQTTSAVVAQFLYEVRRYASKRKRGRRK